MAHELAGALQQTGRIRQRCSVKEHHVYVRGESIDVAEERIFQTCNRTAIMQKLPDLVPAFSHQCGKIRCFTPERVAILASGTLKLFRKKGIAGAYAHSGIYRVCLIDNMLAPVATFEGT